MDSRIIILLIVFINLIGLSKALKGTKYVVLDQASEFVNYLYFGFLNGGHIKIMTELSNMGAPVTQWICKYEDIEYLKGDMFSFESFVDLVTLVPLDRPLTFTQDQCEDLTESFIDKCQWFSIDSNLTKYNYEISHSQRTITLDFDSPSTNNTSWENYPEYKVKGEYNLTIEKDGIYYFFISSCDNESTLNTQIKYDMLNPGSEHLSKDTIPNKSTFLVCFIIWIGVFTLGALTLIYTRAREVKYYWYSTLLTVLAFIYMVDSITEYVRWRLLSKYGILNATLEHFLLGLQMLETCYYLLIIIMISTGFRVMYPWLKIKRSCKTFIVVFFILLTTLLMEYSNYYLMIFFIVEIVLLIILLKMDIDFNISKIIDIIEGRDHVEHSRALKEACKFKHNFYRIFKIYMYTFWTMEILVLSIHPLFELYYEWIFLLLHQILTLTNVGFVYILLNFDAPKLFKTIKNDDDDDDDLYVDEEQPMPLPFDKSKNPRIVGDIIIINSVDDTQGGYYCVGVETSFSHRMSHIKSPKLLKHNNRSLAYKMNESSECSEEIKYLPHQNANDATNKSTTCDNTNFQTLHSRNNGKMFEEIKRPISDDSKEDSVVDTRQTLQVNLASYTSNDKSIKTIFPIQNNNKFKPKHKAENISFCCSRVIDFTNQENIDKFLDLDAHCPIRRNVCDSVENQNQSVDNGDLVSLGMVQLEFQTSF